MAKRRLKRRHSVKANICVHKLTKAGTSIDLEVSDVHGRLGDITVGRGGLVWHGANKQSSKRIGWTRFAKMMNEIAYGE